MSMHNPYASGRGGGQDGGGSWATGVIQAVPTIIGDETKAGVLIEKAQLVGQQIKSDVSTSQIRNVFGPVRQIQLRWRADSPDDEAQRAFRQVMLLRPKLAYQAKRVNKPGFYTLESILSSAIGEIGKAADPGQRYERFRRFAEFFEAILAYHTAAGGK